MKKVMFVCRRNSCRSQMAEGFAKSLGEGKITVVSAGLEASRVHPTAIEVMAEVGIDLTLQTSDALEDFEPTDFDVVISMCGCGSSLPEPWVQGSMFQDWQLDDPDGQPLEEFQRVRDEIKVKVIHLMAQL
ncbi:MAG: arsenate reductase, glutathione/glutaredoxin type [Synechococcaceae cyanobacterium RL_1_2]|nr:arsenate reductase, glutathione/glutaredoxin type [Synechococcaceae cyanobacterium RL_1_2]